MIGPAQRTWPVTVGIGGTSSAWNFMPVIGARPTPSSCLRKSRCQKSRRYSPSVTTGRPIASCFATARSISRSSTARRSPADERAGAGLSARLAQLGRPQEAADVLGAERGPGRSSASCRAPAHHAASKG